MSERPVRLPLEIGVTALFDFAFGVLVLPLALAVVLLGVVVAWWMGSDAGDALKVPIGMAMVGGLLAWYGARLIVRAWRARPADLVFEAARVRVDGGPSHGFVLDYASIDPARCVLTQVKESEDVAQITSILVGTDTISRLTLHGRVLAEGDAPDELDSMREVYAALRARAGGAEAPAPVPPGKKKKHGAPATAPPTTTGVLACPACGALAVPRDEATVACASCGAPVPIPSDIRERVRAAAVVDADDRRITRAVERLLDQPGARATTIQLAISLALIGAAWPLAVWGFVHFHDAGTLDLATGAALAVLPLLLVADGFFLSRARLVDRHALGTLVIGFGARPPAAAGARPTCRACGAALPDGAATVVRCAFCGAANVTGVDLRALAGRAESSTVTLESALDARSRRRRAWRLRTLASLPLFALTAWLLRGLLA